MPFVPHSEEDIASMLEVIGVDRINDLFSEIPEDLKCTALDGVPDGLNEMQVARLLGERATMDEAGLCFIGAGAYEHHIPAVVWELASRGELMTAYTPYQAEASQGGLQIIYEYQTMMTRLMHMDVSNASLYDGASALAEAVLMAARIRRKPTPKQVYVLGTLNPVYKQVIEAIVSPQGITIDTLPFCDEQGVVLPPSCALTDAHFALVIQQPNVFGHLEDVDMLTDWAHAQGLLVIGMVNPIAMSLLKPPGQWGEKGADIACGEGQPLGIPLASGGPYFGFMTCRKEHVRQMPGRIVGRTEDLDGKPGFTLTLQAREQHIRRSKARSNICTNQGLMVTATTIYMSLLGGRGLRRVALTCHERARQLHDVLVNVPGVSRRFTAPFFHECVMDVGQDANAVLQRLSERGIQGGFPLENAYPAFKNDILVCATETKTDSDIAAYGDVLKEVV